MAMLDDLLIPWLEDRAPEVASAVMAVDAGPRLIAILRDKYSLPLELGEKGVVCDFAGFALPARRAGRKPHCFRRKLRFLVAPMLPRDQDILHDRLYVIASWITFQASMIFVYGTGQKKAEHARRETWTQRLTRARASARSPADR
jgi:hypothetical protein